MVDKPAGSACLDCPARKNKLVPAEPAKGKTRLVVVGEAPGRTEVETGRPFSGASGRSMEFHLRKLGGLSREDVHWTNSILCDVDPKDIAAARKCCARRLTEEINATGCNTVLAVGSYALQSAIGINRKPSILKYRGSVILKDDPIRGEDSCNATVVASIHPAYVMRAPLWSPIFEADIYRACRVSKDGFVPPEEVDGRTTVFIESFDQLKDLAPKLDELVAVDVETTGLDIYTVDMVCFVLSDEKLTLVVPWSRTQRGEGKFFGERQEEVAAFVTEILSTRTALTHNGPAYDHTVLNRYGIYIDKWEDSLLAYHAITSLFPKNLAHVASCYIDAPPWKGWSHNLDLPTLYKYCGRDGLYTRLAFSELSKSMDVDDIRVYQADKETANLCREISNNGFLFDSDRAVEMAEGLRAREDALQKEAASILGVREINLLSPIQMHRAFFKQLGAHVCFYSDKGAPSLGSEALRAYAASANPNLARFANLVLEYRRVRKCRTTYVTGPKPHEDGRIHPTWLSYGTVSGRWSASKPNLANLPRPENDPSHRLGLGGIRSLYVVAPGRKLVAWDASQVEFRVAAYTTGDPNMIFACEQSDVHAANAALLFEGFDKLEKKSPVWNELRNLAKTSGFAVCYLAEAATVHARLTVMGMNISLRKVEAMIAALREKFKVYYGWQADALDKCIRCGYVESPILGRKRWLGHSPKPPEAANFPIQSGAADAFNVKSIEIARRFKATKLDAKIVAGVYDALYVDVAERDVDAVRRIAKEVWAEPVLLGGREVVLPIDLKVGDRWSEC